MTTNVQPIRIHQTSITTGTGTYSLIVANTSVRNFNSVYASGTKVPYCVTDSSSGYEIGVGVLTTGSPDTITRDSIILSSNSNSAVNWGTGTKQIFAWELGPSTYINTFSSTKTITITDWGNTFVFTGSSSTVLNLPALSSVPNGYNISVKNSGTNNIVVTPNGTDVIETLAGGAVYTHTPGSNGYYVSDGTVWRQGILGIAPTLTNSLIVGGGIGSSPFTNSQTNLTTNTFSLTAADGSPYSLTINSNSNGVVGTTISQVVMSNTGGTSNSPSATLNNQYLFGVVAKGYDGSIFIFPAGIYARTNTLFSGTNSSTKLNFYATSDSASSSTLVMTLHSGMILPDSVSGGDKGFGTINISTGYYLNGTQITGLTGGTSGGIPYYNSGGTLSSSAVLNANELVIGRGPGSAPISFTQSGVGTESFNLTGLDGTPFGININVNANGVANNAYSQFTILSSGGTANSPAATLSGQILFGIVAGAYNGSSYLYPCAMYYRASSTFTSTNSGCFIHFYTTRDGTNGSFEVLKLQNGAQIPAGLTGGDMGVGTVNVNSGYYINGKNVSPGQTQTLISYTGSVPGALSSSSFTMLGLNYSINPISSSRVVVILQGSIRTSVVGSTGHIRIYYGTGTPPSNGAALTGNFANVDIQFVMAASTENFAPIIAVLTGLSLGTSYWIDIAISISSGSVTYFNNNYIVFEI